MQFSITPKNLIEGLLRAAQLEAISVKAITAVGELFGFKHNTVRVMLSRLSAQGLLLSDNRSYYRLSAQASAMSAFVERWKLGEDRVLDWQGEWICCQIAAGSQRSQRQLSLRALERWGFRSGLGGLMMRPANLNLTLPLLLEQLGEIGLAENSECFIGHDFSQQCLDNWRQHWDIDALLNSYREAIEEMQASTQLLLKKPLEEALPESFELGGRGIYILALDPLLPTEFVDSSLRQQLTLTLLQYDNNARALWNDAIAQYS